MLQDGFDEAKSVVSVLADCAVATSSICRCSKRFCANDESAVQAQICPSSQCNSLVAWRYEAEHGRRMLLQTITRRSEIVS